MRSKDKYSIRIERMPDYDPCDPATFLSDVAPAVEIQRMEQWDGKHWVIVKFQNGAVWIPSFEDLAHILKAIGWCEDQKYRASYHQGRQMVSAFVVDVINGHLNWDQIMERFKIPTRDVPDGGWGFEL